MSAAVVALIGPAWRPPMRRGASITQDRWIGCGVAVVAHALLFWVGGQWWVERAEYGVEAGSGGLAVHLVAALPHSPGDLGMASGSMDGRQSASVQPQASASIPESGAISALEMVTATAVPPVISPSVTSVARAPSDAVGDGSSPVPGTDATTVYAPGGAWTSAQPRYLRNPAPPYPEAARQQGQEGPVLLTVEVNAAGSPDRVRVTEGSGVPLLDEAALQAVRRWRFQPARIGGLPVASTVDVPIIFRLE